MINVTVWNENVHEEDEKLAPIIMKNYGGRIHEVLSEIVGELGDSVSVKTATLDQPHQGLPEELLNSTDVLIWWAHTAHNKVEDELALRVQQRVLKGMGLIVLHSGHLSKPFKFLMGTSCNLRWRHETHERIFCTDPTHPIAKGIPPHFEVGTEECYGEFFDIPKPDYVIFQSWFDIGEVFRSGCTWSRGYGKVFYFRPGHETNVAYNNKFVRQIIKNAVLWAAPSNTIDTLSSPHIDVTLEDRRKA